MRDACVWHPSGPCMSKAIRCAISPTEAATGNQQEHNNAKRYASIRKRSPPDASGCRHELRFGPAHWIPTSRDAPATSSHVLEGPSEPQTVLGWRTSLRRKPKVSCRRFSVRARKHKTACERELMSLRSRMCAQERDRRLDDSTPEFRKHCLPMSCCHADVSQLLRRRAYRTLFRRKKGITEKLE